MLLSWTSDCIILCRAYICPGGEERTGPCPIAPSDRNILYENRMLGLPRIRQLRVHNDSCEVHPDFQSAIRFCYAKYTEDVEDRSNFGPGVRLRTSPSAWMYKNAEELKTSSMITQGNFGYYSGGGATQNFHSLKNETKMIIHELKEGLWINRATRAVFIDFTVYNANVNLFCVIKLIFEFPATGGIMPSSEFRTVKLIRWSRDSPVISSQYSHVATSLGTSLPWTTLCWPSSSCIISLSFTT